MIDSVAEAKYLFFISFLVAGTAMAEKIESLHIEDQVNSMIATKTLTPHPIYFSVDGRPAKTETPYGIVEWDGESLSFEEGKPVNRIWKYLKKTESKKYQSEDEPWTRKGCMVECLILLFGSCGFWGGLTWLISLIW